MDSFLFVGLGNPGAQYEHTRHNLGTRALREWVEKISGGSAVWREDVSLQAEVTEITVEGKRLMGLFPLTYMNNSGRAVAAFLKNNPVEPSHILVIHDELQFPLGEVKIKEGGSAAGHKGVKSIHESLSTQDIPRLRLGIGRPLDATPVDEYVLQKFSPQEEGIVQQMVKRAGEEMTRVLQRNS